MNRLAFLKKIALGIIAGPAVVEGLAAEPKTGSIVVDGGVCPKKKCYIGDHYEIEPPYWGRPKDLLIPIPVDNPLRWLDDKEFYVIGYPASTGVLTLTTR